MKAAGAVCVLASALWGFLLQRKERRTVRKTRLEILSALRRMSEEIRLARTPMPELLEAVASDCSGAGAVFFRSVSLSVRAGNGMNGAWRQAVDALPLEAGERSALRELGQAFGGDEERMCRALSLAAAVLERRAREVEEQCAEEEKRSAALWGCGSAMTVILLM